MRSQRLPPFNRRQNEAGRIPSTLTILTHGLTPETLSCDFSNLARLRNLRTCALAHSYCARTHTLRRPTNRSHAA